MKLKETELISSLFHYSVEFRMAVRLVRKIRSVIEKGAKFYLHMQICEKICDPALYTTCTENPKTKNVID